MIDINKMSKVELLAIVKKCPRTKDGMPVVPSVDVVYHPDLFDDEGKPDACSYNDYNGLWTSPENDASRKVEECYSTLELALFSGPNIREGDVVGDLEL